MVTIEIEPAVIVDVIAGAVGLMAALILPALPFLPIVFVLAAAGKADVRPRRLLMLIPYALAGAIIGGICSIWMSWWGAGLVAFAIGGVVNLIYMATDRLRRNHWRQSY